MKENNIKDDERCCKYIDEIINSLEDEYFELQGNQEEIKGINEIEFLFGTPDGFINENGLQKGQALLRVLEKDFQGAERWDIITDSIQSDFNVIGEKIPSKYLHVIDNPVRWRGIIKPIGYGYKYVSEIKCCKPYIIDRKYCHAKVMASTHDNGKTQIVWTGSANYTRNAFEKNYECCIRYKIQKNDDSFISGVDIPKNKVRSLDQSDINNAENEENFNNIKEYLNNIICIKYKSKTNHTLTLEIVNTGINLKRSKKNYKLYKYTVDDCFIHLPFGNGMVNVDLDKLVKNISQDVELKYRRGSFYENKIRVILTLKIRKNQRDLVNGEVCSVWKKLDLPPNILKGIYSEECDTWKDIKKGKGLFLDNIPKLIDAIPPHKRSIEPGAQNQNVELALATYMNIFNDEAKAISAIEKNIDELLDDISGRNKEELDSDQNRKLEVAECNLNKFKDILDGWR